MTGGKGESDLGSQGIPWAEIQGGINVTPF